MLHIAGKIFPFIEGLMKAIEGQGLSFYLGCRPLF